MNDRITHQVGVEVQRGDAFALCLLLQLLVEVLDQVQLHSHDERGGGALPTSDALDGEEAKHVLKARVISPQAPLSATYVLIG